ncbi:hypothetical protein [Fodinibius salsisoli]|uniref:Uncharacterized protein n=1 Tax=Fodinibius salsisoli TaxID=2820877 RepID=A0ABT3PIS8_9BACT|nr:hypothetical protein [Fodinibius salsisoli]MCW9705653.1 hypothetical protein [Fodinibius salsisoli]
MANDKPNKIKLDKEQIEYLSKLPETGMGYQIVDVTLKNGQKINNQTVLNSEFLLLKRDDISLEQISKIELSKK